MTSLCLTGPGRRQQREVCQRGLLPTSAQWGPRQPPPGLQGVPGHRHCAHAPVTCEANSRLLENRAGGYGATPTLPRRGAARPVSGSAPHHRPRRPGARTLGSTRAPALMRYLTASRWLFSAASISGVRWSSEQLSMLAPACETRASRCVWSGYRSHHLLRATTHGPQTPETNSSHELRDRRPLNPRLTFPKPNWKTSSPHHLQTFSSGKALSFLTDLTGSALSILAPLPSKRRRQVKKGYTGGPQ